VCFSQMMAGACRTLNEAGCALLGGHTCEGAELSLGFAIVGYAPVETLMTKGGMKQVLQTANTHTSSHTPSSRKTSHRVRG